MVPGKSSPLPTFSAALSPLLLSISQIEWQVPLGEGALSIQLYEPSLRDTSRTQAHVALVKGATLWGEALGPDDDPSAASILYDPRDHPIALSTLQLREQSEYLLEVAWEGEGPAPTLRCFPQLHPPVMRRLPQGRSPRVHRAQLNFRDFVGATTLQIFVDDQLCFTTHLEVRSRKLDYLEDYVALLDAIAAHSVALLLRPGSPVSATFLPGADAPVSAGLVQLLVLRHVICGDWLPQALAHISQAPELALAAHPQRAEVGRHPMRSAAEAAAGLRRGGERCKLPPAQAARLPAQTQGVLPRYFVRRGQRLSPDTPENRFVQALFARLHEILQQLLRQLAGHRFVGFQRELARIQSALFQCQARCKFLVGVPPLARATLPRQALRARPGYRELLDLWDLAEQDLELIWTEAPGDDILLGPLRDLAGLYEIWCYFALWEALASFADGPAPHAPIENQPLSARLPRDQATPFRFLGMDVLLSYQRRFSSGEEGHHSYSVALTPDFTIEAIRPDGTKVLLCFDAKYRPDGALEKMHAYRDALRGALGCYLFYPGQQEQPTLYHRHPRFPLPGVGAFPLRPSTSLDDWLSPFLQLCLEQVAGSSE